MQPKTIAGRYEVERAVGQGEMGTVWLCHDDVLNRQVAVKEVGNMPGASTSDLARALREARNNAALNHRNVVSIYDAVEDDDHNWLVMEYLPSRNLSELVAEEGPLSPERVAWIGAQAAEGLAAAHARGPEDRETPPLPRIEPHPRRSWRITTPICPTTPRRRGRCSRRTCRTK